MAKVFIEETTLTAIGNAIRGKEGTTELIPVADMSNRISAITTGGGGGNEPTAEELTLTADQRYTFYGNKFNWFIAKYGNRITTVDLTNCNSMFEACSVEHIPFTINVKNSSEASSLFKQCKNLTICPKIRGTFAFTSSVNGPNLSDTVSYCYNLRDIEDLFLPEMLDGFAEIVATKNSLLPRYPRFQGMYSLRQLPSWFSKYKLNPDSTQPATSFYSPYYYTFENCYVLDEITNLPIWTWQGAVTTNIISYSFGNCFRVKDITFETNPDGSPIVVSWKAQTMDLSNNIGYVGNYGNTWLANIVGYNSGITEDKKVYTGELYQALKNDPDWFAYHPNNSAEAMYYSRYNHDSAVRTINSLPDTSAYLATAGGTNTIKFRGISGKNTDAGAINTLTEEEIAVATAKGWTVTLV